MYSKLAPDPDPYLHAAYHIVLVIAALDCPDDYVSVVRFEKIDLRELFVVEHRLSANAIDVGVPVARRISNEDLEFGLGCFHFEYSHSVNTTDADVFDIFEGGKVLLGFEAFSLVLVDEDLLLGHHYHVAVEDHQLIQLVFICNCGRL